MERGAPGARHRRVRLMKAPSQRSHSPMVKHLRHRLTPFLILLVAGLFLFRPAPESRQASINSTTLSNAITATQLEFAVASTSAVSVGDLFFVDNEVGRIVSIPSSGRVSVRRGQE